MLIAIHVCKIMNYRTVFIVKMKTNHNKKAVHANYNITEYWQEVNFLHNINKCFLYYIFHVSLKMISGMAREY